MHFSSLLLQICGVLHTNLTAGTIHSCYFFSYLVCRNLPQPLLLLQDSQDCSRILLCLICLQGVILMIFTLTTPVNKTREISLVFKFFGKCHTLKSQCTFLMHLHLNGSYIINLLKNIFRKKIHIYQQIESI